MRDRKVDKREMEHLDPYLVIGTGRCGTTTTARILHQNLGVCMGTVFHNSFPQAPFASYEDKEFADINYSLEAGGVNLSQWLQCVTYYIYKRQITNKPWGVKDLYLVDLLGLYLSLFDSPKIIWCVRDKKDTMASWCRVFRESKEEAECVYEMRTMTIKRLLVGRDYLELDFTKKRNEDEIERLIREKWKDKK